MSRKHARELAFQILFQVDVGKHQWRKVLDYSLSQATELASNDRHFLEVLVTGVSERQREIDDLISRFSREWTLERLASADRNILRMALFELKYLSEIPAGATVNEAVELAKRYGDVDSGKFVNGILGEIARNAADQPILAPQSDNREETTEE
jgi:N utilization substance protein B